MSAPWILRSLCLFLFIFSFTNAQATSILEFNGVLEAHFARENQISKEQWEDALPTEYERTEAVGLVNYLMSLLTFSNVTHSSVLSLFPRLRNFVNITFFEDKYAVVHEILRDDADNRSLQPFSRYWGYVVITGRKYATKPYLHHSSPHFESDGDVGNQSAAIFEATASRSLVVAGASRYAVRDNNATNPCAKNYAVADAAHNNLTMFHTFNTAIFKVSKVIEATTVLPDDIFLQWHGMSERSCIASPVLISIGAKGTDEVYNDPNLTANKLKLAYGNGAHNPMEDPSCNLAATTNIFGRLINGVPEDEVCLHSAAEDDIKGQFLHLEQKRQARDDHLSWIKATQKAFRES
uniref:DDE Tnp4 domain-containing protein n=1 Tax=Panagrellus redivivus TaxID=6233 RepID=A0A7E4UZ44_PANRE